MINQIIHNITPLDKNSMELAIKRQAELLKPMGSLGALEDISIKLAGITGNIYNDLNKKILFLFGADNGVYEEGISASPQHFTNLLMSFYGDNKNCAINVICKQNNVDLKIIDIGVIGELDYTNIQNKKLMNGTNNFLKNIAMTKEVAEKVINIGIEYAKFAKENNYNIIGNGEVGMGNTTTATACILTALGINDMSFVGRGAGLTDKAFEIKKTVIQKALELHKPKQDDGLDILSKVGGLDIAAIVGLYIGAAYYKIPIVVDGVISIAAALIACTFNDSVKDYMIPSHISEEPAYKLAADKLGFTPMLNLGMRLGEGTGCPIAMGVIDSATAVLNNMNTFSEVSLDSKYREKLKVK